MAAITQQVGLHCRERGFLLAHIWNLHVGLQEYEAEQLSLHNRALRHDNGELQVAAALLAHRARTWRGGEAAGPSFPVLVILLDAAATPTVFCFSASRDGVTWRCTMHKGSYGGWRRW